MNTSPSNLQVEFNMNFSGLSRLETAPQRSSRGSQCDKKPATNFRLSMQQEACARSWKLLSSFCPPNTNKVNRVARKLLPCKLNHGLILQALLHFQSNAAPTVLTKLPVIFTGHLSPMSPMCPMRSESNSLFFSKLKRKKKALTT